MSKLKQFTIIMPGNRFGVYLSKTMDGYFTKWKLEYRYYPEDKPGYGHHKLKNATVKGINLSENEITDQLIDRTKEWYQAIYIDCCPGWLEDLTRSAKNEN